MININTSCDYYGFVSLQSIDDSGNVIKRYERHNKGLPFGSKLFARQLLGLSDNLPMYLDITTPGDATLLRQPVVLSKQIKLTHNRLDVYQNPLNYVLNQASVKRFDLIYSTSISQFKLKILSRDFNPINEFLVNQDLSSFVNPSTRMLVSWQIILCGPDITQNFSRLYCDCCLGNVNSIPSYVNIIDKGTGKSVTNYPIKLTSKHYEPINRNNTQSFFKIVYELVISKKDIVINSSDIIVELYDEKMLNKIHELQINDFELPQDEQSVVVALSMDLLVDGLDLEGEL